MKKLLQHKLNWLFALVVFAMVNILASLAHTKFDLTKEKTYTISKATKDILKHLNDEVEITVF